MTHFFLLFPEFLLLFIQLVLAFGACFYLLTVFFGAPFVPTPMALIRELGQIAEISPDDVVIDLGSGDGRMLIYAAKLGARAEGWEINPVLVFWTRLIARCRGLTKKATVHLQNYHKANLSTATIIFLYGFTPHMPKLEAKLRKELAKGTKIISYKFRFPNLEPVAIPKPGVFIYVI